MASSCRGALWLSSVSKPSAHEASVHASSSSRGRAGSTWAGRHQHPHSSMVKVPPLAVPQLGSCASPGRAWRLWAARRSQEVAGPLGAQPLPRVLKLATPPTPTPVAAAQGAQAGGGLPAGLLLVVLVASQAQRVAFLPEQRTLCLCGVPQDLKASDPKPNPNPNP